MNQKTGKNLWFPATLVIVLALLMTIPASAAVWTDKPDYQPGETVTISGASDETNQYLPGETVEVTVYGPNDYLQTCLAADGLSPVAAEDGSWSCQVVLYPDERAAGGYTYTADGVVSFVHEEGTFTDLISYTWWLDTRVTFIGGDDSGSCGGTVTERVKLETNVWVDITTCLDPIFHIFPWPCPATDWIQLAGREVIFSLGSSSAWAVTDTNGEAEVTLVVPEANSTVSVSYPGELLAYYEPWPFELYGRLLPTTGGKPLSVTCNKAPVASNDNYRTTVETPLNVPAPGVLANDSDPNIGDSLSAEIVTSVQHGELSLNTNGSFTYTPDTGFIGVDEFFYLATDGGLDSNWATVRITVPPSPTSDDPFDYAQGTVVVGHDTIIDPINAFRVTGGFEDGNTLMRNGGLGSWSYIDYQTSSPVSIIGVILYGHNDQAGCCMRRAMSGFRLYADQDGDGIVENPPIIDRTINPYYNSEPDNLTDSYGDLTLILLTDGVVRAQNWRLEIQQGSNLQPYEGARLVELDAIAAPNSAPELTVATDPVVVGEGAEAVNTGTVSDADGNMVTLTASAGEVNNNGDGTWSWSLQTTDGPDNSQAVTITADDGNGGISEASFQLTVNNVAPSVTTVNDLVTVNEGQTATKSGGYSDPGADDVTLSASIGTLTYDNGTWSWSFDSSDGPDESQWVTVQATDSDGASFTLTFRLNVNNLPPVISAITSPIEPISLGQPINISATFTDAGVYDTHEAYIDWNDGTNEIIHPYTSGVSIPHTYSGAGVYHVGVTISDDDGALDFKYSEWVVIYDPTAGFVTGGGWFEYHALPYFDGSFYQVVAAPWIEWEAASQAAEAAQLSGCMDSHLLTITSPEEQAAIFGFFGGTLQDKWMGGNQTGDVNPEDGWYWITGEAWEYASWGDGEPNDYFGPQSEQSLMFKVDGSWNDGQAGYASGYVIEYDQCNTTGKATFGFVSKYQKGTNVPTGNTEFQFNDADLNFHSTSYEWLLVTGGNYAKFKGEGSINGEGTYKFMIWAGDGTGEGGADTFRIKIWTEEGGFETVIYDNVIDQAISGGSIVVHSN